MFSIEQHCSCVGSVAALGIAVTIFQCDEQKSVGIARDGSQYISTQPTIDRVQSFWIHSMPHHRSECGSFRQHLLTVMQMCHKPGQQYSYNQEMSNRRGGEGRGDAHRGLLCFCFSKCNKHCLELILSSGLLNGNYNNSSSFSVRHKYTDGFFLLGLTELD